MKKKSLLGLAVLLRVLCQFPLAVAGAQAISTQDTTKFEPLMDPMIEMDPVVEMAWLDYQSLLSQVTFVDAVQWYV